MVALLAFVRTIAAQIESQAVQLDKGNVPACTFCRRYFGSVSVMARPPKAAKRIPLYVSSLGYSRAIGKDGFPNSRAQQNLRESEAKSLVEAINVVEQATKKLDVALFPLFKVGEIK